MIARGQDGKVQIELDLTETGHLFSILLHAKFGDEVKMHIVGMPTMRSLLEQLFAAYAEAGGTRFTRPLEEDWIIDETDSGLRGPPAFEIIESNLMDQDDYKQSDLDDHLFPFRWIARKPKDRFIGRGRIVRLETKGASTETEGVCIDCWRDEASGTTRALIAWVPRADLKDGPVEDADLRFHDATELRIIR